MTTTTLKMPWGTLRPGLLADLGFGSAAELAETIGYDDVPSVQRALDGEPPADEFMTALLRHFLTTPPLYFVSAAKPKGVDRTYAYNTTGRALAHAVGLRRAELGLTTSELAVRAGMSGPSLSKRIAGVTSIDTNDIDRLAQALEIDPFDLMSMAERYRSTIFMPVWRMTDVIRHAMEDAQISQADMARATGIPLRTLNRRLSRQGRPWLMCELAAVARVLEVSVTALIVASHEVDAPPTASSDWRAALEEVLGSTPAEAQPA